MTRALLLVIAAVWMAADAMTDHGIQCLAALLHRHGIGCRGRDTELARWHQAAAEALALDGVVARKGPAVALTPPPEPLRIESFRPLLSWAEAVRQHHAMLRSEPPFTTTAGLGAALDSAYAALSASETGGNPR